MKTYSQINLGKNGISSDFISTLKDHFKNHKNVKVVVLKSARENKDAVKKYSEEILGKLGPFYTAKIIGFTIFVKRWRMAVREAKTL